MARHEEEYRRNYTKLFRRNSNQPAEPYTQDPYINSSQGYDSEYNADYSQDSEYNANYAQDYDYDYNYDPSNDVMRDYYINKAYYQEPDNAPLKYTSRFEGRSRRRKRKTSTGFDGYYDHRTGKHGSTYRKGLARGGIRGFFRKVKILFVLLLILAAVAAGFTVKAGSFLSDGDSPLVVTAKSEIGNKGGEKFWSWYGYTEEVDWCGCFVSFVADSNGYIDAGQIPKFSYCQEGINWFDEQDRYHTESDYKPKGGDVIFFDWNDNDIADHVGIVSGTGFGRIYTIEGNTGDNEVMRKGYWSISSYIMGYGEVD